MSGTSCRMLPQHHKGPICSVNNQIVVYTDLLYKLVEQRRVLDVRFRPCSYDFKVVLLITRCAFIIHNRTDVSWL